MSVDNTYVGSQAAEVALLLRRVLHAFGMESDQVSFIATSATIGRPGDPDSQAKLQEYLASIAGVPRERVLVIEGEREIPELPPELKSSVAEMPDDAILRGMGPEERFRALAAVPAIRSLRQRLAQGPARLSELAATQAGVDASLTGSTERSRALRTLDNARHGTLDGAPLLPLRAHLFHRTQNGAWACCNPTCSGLADTELAASDWHFGKLFLERREKCEDCESKVFELVLCSRCGAEYLAAELRIEGGDCYLEQRPMGFTDDDGPTSLDEQAEDIGDSEGTGEAAARSHRMARLVGPYEAKKTDTRNGTLHIQLNVESGLCRSDELNEVGARFWATVPDDRRRLWCASCGEYERRPNQLLRSARAGSAFLLGVAIPTLLEYSPEFETKSRDLPFRGRRTITFSDSRQGTARFALRTSIEAERRFVRSFLYHEVSQSRASAEQRAAKEQQLREIEEALASGALPDAVARTLEGQRNTLHSELEGMSHGQLKWNDARRRIASGRDVAVWLREVWKERGDGQVFSNSINLAEFFLLREFVRRPVRQNSLETLGLVALRYQPLLDRRLDAHVPDAGKKHQLQGHEWNTLLEIILDFFVRTNSAIDIEDDYLRWMGTSVRRTFILGPSESSPGRRQVLWPYLRKRRRPPRLARLLAKALDLDLENPDDREDINALLRAAWDQLRDLRLLVSGADGAQLSLREHAVLTTVDRAWLCPVTRRLLDTSLRGVTPFFSSRDQPPPGDLLPVDMPLLRYVFPSGSESVSADDVARWLENDARVQHARELGVWTETSDRIATFTPYYRVAEHSAQIRGYQLVNYERQFKEGKLNLLSCSTTMEMGVDIGGLSSVAMNNAPPGPANFQQRAGRAGRRGETAAVSLTMCKGLPHGEAVFRDPLWPFTTPVHVPHVSLESERIVQRHVNAMALTHYLRRVTDNAPKTTMSTFFESERETSSHAERFALWLESQDGGSAEEREDLERGLRQITHGSCLLGLPTPRLLERTREAMNHVQRDWSQEIQFLLEELAEVGGDPNQEENPGAAQLAISRQLERMRGEYLLSELSGRGFLPAHGFPTGVVPFIDTTLEELDKRRRQKERARRARKEGRAVDDLGWSARGEYPARSVEIAIREYAPGSDVVIDGQVLRSQGVTLNWRIPPSDKASRELQAFLHAWRCKDCGAVDSSRVQRSACAEPACGSGNLTQIPYLQPAGFSVRITDRPSNDLTSFHHIPVRQPWVSAGGGQWQEVVRPELGRLRATDRGRIFFRNGGQFGQGYSLCLYCGFAAAVLPPDMEEGARPRRPALMENHPHLRGGKDPDGHMRCRGNDRAFLIKDRLFFGAMLETDIFELQLQDPRNAGAVVRDPVVLSSIAVALRQALAESLGIVDREIGWTVTPSRAPNGESGRSLVLYDTASGGECSRYGTRAAEESTRAARMPAKL